jgi:glycogen debranching enzyme
MMIFINKIILIAKAACSVLLLISFGYSHAQNAIVPRFPLNKNVLTLIRTAQPNQYTDRIGQKAALMGYESGSFEMWIWPWKVLRNFELQFFTGTSTTPILAKDIVKEISVTPEASIITYSYESFTVRAITFIPVDKPAAVILLDIHSTEDIAIVPGFIPVMQPQWPAGVGGQYSYWDRNMNAFVIAESQQRGIFLCGSPAGKQMTAPPAHMFADNPMQFRIDVKKEEALKGYIPIIITGSPVKTKYDSVKVLYKDILNSIPELYNKNVKYYRGLQENTISIVTPSHELNLALEWGKIGLRNLMVDNAVLGKGLVAGYGMSGGGGRPGFAWFFGGDAFINSLAMCSYQDYTSVKDALLFTQKWQRQEDFPIRKKSPDDKAKDVGKIAHELSQSDGIVDWWNDYHFGYNHADTSPWYLTAMGNYFRNTGDIQFIKDSWKSLVQAYRWCISKDSNGDGLMDLKGAGLGVLEFGTLVNIHNDIYTQVLWTQGLKEMINMSYATDDNSLRKEAENLLNKALPALEKLYWMEDLGYYSFGANEEGKQVREKSIYSSSALFFMLVNEDNAESTLKKFNTSEMMTGWGVRNLSNKSELYNPANYNYGTVWPFTSYMIGTAEYNYNFNLQGYSILSNTIENIFNYGLGVAPEVLSGDLNTKLAEAYHNQGFSYSGFILPIMRGLMGLETDAVNNTLTFAPKFPADWDDVSIKNIKLNTSTLAISFKKSSDKISFIIHNTGENEITFHFNPVLSPGIKIRSVTVNGTEQKFTSVETEYSTTTNLDLKAGKETTVELNFVPVPEIYFINNKYPLGSVNKSIVINSYEYIEGKLLLAAEVFDGEEYELGITNPELAERIEGAELEGSILKVTAGNEGSGEYRQKNIIIHLKK